MNKMTIEAVPEESESTSGIQVIARAATVLRALEIHPDGMSLTQIAKAVRLPRSTVQRIVSALAAEDFLTPAGAGGGVRIGAGLARLGASVGSNASDLVRPHLRVLGAAVEETVDLAVLSSGSVLFIDQIPGRHRLLALSAVGERFPLHCTANGKAILACFDEANTEELLRKSLKEHPDFPLRNRRTLMREIHDTKRTHVAFDLEEHAKGVSAVGVAMLDALGRPVAVSIPAPSQRFPEQRDRLVARILEFRDRAMTALSK
ncbi:MAG TPA: IclR family transcriptional regulator [Beijerinckiaceae bacterium]|nr:IclR family transcriptional regulator [Beijerinckiaceae bacterium]